MAQKLSYAELLQQVAFLENELAGCKQIEKNLWKYQEQLYSILDSLDAIVYVADMESYEVLFVNKYTERIFGNIVGEKCWQSLQAHQKGPCSFCTNDKLLTREGEPGETISWDFLNTFDNKWYDVRDKAIKWFDGRIVRLEIAIDISERKKSEEALRKSEEKFRTVADFTYDWEYWVDPGGNYVYISPSSEQVTGYRPDAFKNDPQLLLSITHPEDKTLLEKHFAMEMDKKSACHFDFRIVTRGGQERWIGHCCQPVFDSQGKFIGRRASNRNITKRKLMEEKLHESEKRFRLALDASSDGVWDRNLLTNEIFFGENWYRVLGYTLDDLKTQDITWEKLLHPEDKQEAILAIEEHIAGETSRYEAEFRLRNKAGNWQWILSRGKVVEWDDTGRPLRIIGTHTDITSLKNIEKELQRAKKDLEKRVTARTAELEEMNVALKVLLNKRVQDRQDFEQQILTNVAELMDPYFEKLEKTSLSEQQKTIVGILKSNLVEITSSFAHSLSGGLAKLTPTEIQVANLVKQGKATKEIAELMHLSPGTISIHRKNIRKKLGIAHKKANLQSLLSSYSQ